jgi:hypothetical protein
MLISKRSTRISRADSWTTDHRCRRRQRTTTSRGPTRPPGADGQSARKQQASDVDDPPKRASQAQESFRLWSFGPDSFSCGRKPIETRKIEEQPPDDRVAFSPFCEPPRPIHTTWCIIFIPWLLSWASWWCRRSPHMSLSARCEILNTGAVHDRVVPSACRRSRRWLPR